MSKGGLKFSLGGAAGMSFEGLLEACEVTERLGFEDIMSLTTSLLISLSD